ncbi:MAG TPA: dihydrodipicolinate synthase family protein [Burkholderiales bacterium]|nr:dihydrodipicolinate synthase family protein [Burkholderiales bacterium]
MQLIPGGIHVMQYAFFDAQGALDRQAMRRQARAAIEAGAHGVAVLGLATEVNKLAEAERATLVRWLAEDLDGRLPFAVTIAGGTVEAQVLLARHAQDVGAAWLILQPPPLQRMPEADCARFFLQVMEEVDVPVAIQNAPEYTGIGLSDETILALAAQRPNFRLIKAEGAAVTIARTIEATRSALRVFNGRGGLELIDNLRAGCAGMIPATDTFDYQVRIFELMRSDTTADVRQAEQLYQHILPAIVFVMQSLDSLICYGKRIAALRLGLGEVHDRAPAMRPTAFGLECAQRYARALGPLP